MYNAQQQHRSYVLEAVPGIRQNAQRGGAAVGMPQKSHVVHVQSALEGAEFMVWLELVDKRPVVEPPHRRHGAEHFLDAAVQLRTRGG